MRSCGVSLALRTAFSRRDKPITAGLTNSVPVTIVERQSNLMTMGGKLTNLNAPADHDQRCKRCRRPLRPNRSFLMRAGEGRVCSLGALIDGVMLRRSAMLALIVGTFLVLLNQCDELLGAQRYRPRSIGRSR